MSGIRTLRRWPDNRTSGQLTAIVAVGEQETVPDRVELEELGSVRVTRIRKTDIPEPGLTRGERVLVLDVREDAGTDQ